MIQIKALTPALLVLAGLTASPAPVPQGEPTTITVDEVSVGQRGYGLSVFAGATPERFEVEVLGVLRNYNPGLSYVITRLSGHDLEKTGVASGMSGSPVFLDGRLLGAVAFTWPAAQEPIAGITPIDAMRALSRLPAGGEGGGEIFASAPALELEQLLARNVPQDLLERHLERLDLTSPGGAVTSLQWVTSGIGEQSLGRLRRSLTSVVPGGRAAPDAELALVPGGAAAAVLVDGDLQIAATGTITDRQGDEILAFGHPFLGLGEIRVPMAAAEVVTVMSSRINSFKIANLGPVVGAFDQDRLAGVRGRVGLTARTVPVELKVVGAVPKLYRLRIAALPQMMPTLLATSLLSGLEAASYSEGAQGIDLKARFRLAGHGELEIADGFSGSNAPNEAAQLVLAVASYLETNSFSQVEVESIELEVVQSTQPRQAILASARTASAVAQPGDRITLKLDFLPYRDASLRREVELVLPERLPPGKYSLLIGDGRSVDNARLSLEPARPTSFEQALELLRSLHSRRQLVVIGSFKDRGLAVQGALLPQLPPSLRSVWTTAKSADVVHLRSAVAQVEVVEMGVPIQGLVRLELEVKPRPGRDRG